MERKEQFKNVEKVLATFPSEAQQNYYKNKETLEILNVDDLSGKSGVYNFNTNKIKLVNNYALEHELFHMAFNNRINFDKEFLKDFYLNNGVSYRKINSSYTHGIGLNEGFAQSLAERANTKLIGRVFETYIVNLLVAIHGDEIYHFALKNDPVGLNIFCSENLDLIRSNLDFYTINKDKVKNIHDSNDINYNLEISIGLADSIINTIKAIIMEYNSCISPKVTRLEFKTKIEEIFDNKLFVGYFLFKILDRDFINEIEEIIDTELMNKKYLRKEKIQILKKFLHFSRY